MGINSKLSDLQAASALTDAGLIYVVQGGNSRQATLEAVRDFLDAARHVASLTDLKALDTTIDAVAVLNESGREGIFKWTTGDFSTHIAADTVEGVYVKAGDIAATAGAWVRVYSELNVNWFGAVGDGTTDDTAAIQAALDLADFLTGARVFLPAATYIVSDADADTFCLTIDSKTHLYGVRGKSTLKLKNASAACAILRVAESATDVMIEKIVVDGNRDNQTPGANTYGSYMGIIGQRNNAHITYSDLDIINCYGRSLVSNQYGVLSDPLTDPATDIIIDRVRIRNSGTKSVMVRRTLRATVSNCHVETNGVPDDGGVTNSDNSSAFEASNSQHVTFSNSIAKHLNAPWGVTCRGTNSSLYCTWVGIHGEGGRQFASITISYAKVIGCTGLNNSTNAAVLVQAHTGENITDVIIDDNIFINPVDYGVTVGTETAGNGSLINVKVTNNVIRGSGSTMLYGIRNTSAAADCTAYEGGNTITNATTADRTGIWRVNGEITETDFTPSVTFTTPGDVAVGYTTQAGHYWLIGKLVFFKITIITSSFAHSTASGDLRIAGFPFTCLNNLTARGQGSGSFRGITMANFTQFNLNIVQGTTEAVLHASGQGQSDANVTVTQAPNGASLRLEMSGFYERA